MLTPTYFIEKGKFFCSNSSRMLKEICAQRSIFNDRKIFSDVTLSVLIEHNLKSILNEFSQVVIGSVAFIKL